MATLSLPDQNPQGYRPDIDGLRAIAVAAVVLHHAFPAWFSGGFVGVDVFFVVSGYLISTIILTGLTTQTFRFADFYARRIRRIFPALFLVLTAVWVIGWYRLLPVDYQQVGKHILAGSAFVSNFAFWGEADYFDVASASKPLLHLWSLAIEEQFYLLWPISLWFLLRWRMKAPTLVAALVLASFAFNLYLVREDLTAAYYHPAARIWELLIGAMLAILTMDERPAAWWRCVRSHPDLLAGCGAVLLALVLATVQPGDRFPGWWALAVALGTAMLITAGPQAWLNRRLLASRPLVVIGLISYPLYLWHWPLLAFAHIEAAGAPRWEHQILWVLLALLLAWATYRWVEKPIRNGLPSWRRAITVALCAGMFLTAALGYAVHHQGGFEQRFPDIVRHLMSKGGRSAISEGWRVNECMLESRTPPSAFSPSCIEEKRPLVFLWGDSHAGSMYPGFKALQDAGRYPFGLGERTAAICPSLLDTEPRRLCKAINDSTIAAIRASRPDVVVLYSLWHKKEYDLTRLEPTVQAIREAGVPRIILLGPVPYWKKNLPQILLDVWRAGPMHARPPLRLGREYLDPQAIAATQMLRERAAAMGIEFVSGMDYFCDDRGCLTRLSEDEVQPLSYDYGHLSTGAMAYYVEQLAPVIFGRER